MPQRLSDAQMKFLSEFAPKSLAKKKGYAKRTGGAPGVKQTGMARRSGPAPKGKKGAPKLPSGNKDRLTPKAKQMKGKNVTQLRKEASAIRRSLTPKPTSKMKKAELEKYISSHRGKGKQAAAPSGLS